MQRYFCADGRRIPEGHDCDECPACLRAQRDGIRKEYEANVNIDLVARLREMERRVACQRRELARLQAPAPPTPVKESQAFDAWCAPALERWDRRFAAVCFRSGWQAARRAMTQGADQ